MTFVYFEHIDTELSWHPKIHKAYIEIIRYLEHLIVLPISLSFSVFIDCISVTMQSGMLPGPCTLTFDDTSSFKNCLYQIVQHKFHLYL